MSILHGSAVSPSCMSTLHIHTVRSCRNVCFCCTLMLHFLAACPCRMSKVHVLAACQAEGQCCMSMLHILKCKPACPCCMSSMFMPHVHAAYPCLVMLLVHAVRSCRMFTLHVLGAYPCRMSMRHVLVACCSGIVSESYHNCLQKNGGVLAEVLAKVSGS
jgi:hypothetical protein